eukprot:CAMPEP_0206512600 /NCGR_PEP_ID=MMETSP0324_2-20121206/60995_1 /ASSEMBLY_ACC=CAM_ASM_000836 /TAXON_ID=2866 /ORGANISM="Crypthecodinium cohnii, Strain Seligo" /LENGTH=79 /DNA_ID=CAMNT_0054004627 /DNA_START=257 /DNA_END=497 /DNA_ORIENTATION=+
MSVALTMWLFQNLRQAEIAHEELYHILHKDGTLTRDHLHNFRHVALSGPKSLTTMNGSKPSNGLCKEDDVAARFRTEAA